MPETSTQTTASQEDFFNPLALFKRVGINQGMVVADLGSGSGYLTLPLAKYVSERGKVYAIDIMKDSLQVIHDKALSQGNRNVQTVWADAEMVGSTKIAPGTVDMVIMSNIYFQLEKPGEALKEAARIVKKNGKVVVVDWVKGKGPVGPPEELRKDGAEVAQTALGAGLKELEHFEVDQYHYGYIFHK